jgi:outer membrane protein TolC
VKTLILLTLLALFLPVAVRADAGTVSLKQAVDLALQRNHLLKSVASERSAAAQDLSISRSRYLPRIFLDETASTTNSPTRTFMMKLDQGRFTQNDFQIDNLNHPPTHDNFRTALTLEQPLLDFSIGRGVAMAEREDAAAGFALERRRQETAFRVFAACLEVQKARALLAAAEQAQKNAAEYLRLARVRGEAGVGLKSEELRARTFLAEAEQREISARNDLSVARMRLSLTTGGDAGVLLDIDGKIVAPAVAQSYEELFRQALLKRQDLKEAEAEVGKAGAGVGLARSGYLPTVYGSASYQMNDRDIPFGRDNDAWMVGASLRWELFDGLRRSNEVGKAQAMQQTAAEQLAYLRGEIALQVRESLLRREEAEKRLAVARSSVEDSEEGVRLISRRYENSLATMAELLDAETALNQARSRFIENESNLALATGRLYDAAGLFLQEVIR